MPTQSPIAVLLSAVGQRDVPTETLVRAARVVASSAGDTQFAQWCDRELKGYSDAFRDIPEYRKVAAAFCMDTPYGTEIPVVVRDPEAAKVVGTVPMTYPLNEIERMAGADSGTAFQLTFKPDFEARLLKSLRGASRAYRKIQPLAAQGIVAHLRQQVFDWCAQRLSVMVQLPPGVTVHGLLGLAEATEPELNDAASLRLEVQGTGNSIVVNSTDVRVTATITQPEQQRVALELVSALTQAIDRRASDDTVAQELLEAMEQLRAVATMKKAPLAWLTQVTHSVRSIVENAAGGLIAEASKPHLLALIAQILG